MTHPWRRTYSTKKNPAWQPRNPETTHVRRGEDPPEEFKKGIHDLMFKQGNGIWVRTTIEERELLTLDEYRLRRKK
jgi:hypothetical protein